ncbi:hypothetical protein CcaverHIS002_0212680 [Cutaneotrichosporon cavernicola]|uniref:EamA domain-containing protein n=1 Tax=Cutaneotrichosporon cavernicola TaxID=279322 RepID=A0AA48I2G7_9TREE|nr:uncharacterized protein CcaverHIS019_0212680 [Cutaneotrichosporon cavernicola]BEI82108.1 hypothetical protein CcaverHIS002_0212680 [Cutaneotrichosporon cavernicola]BEI89906.1 hypothetical protein CcaverHIS019_0212680 [Cutaneotrichosporon cavernicola]BEI97677.1 hypothetical protein CcaverHIS631_0212660 [Cutaneotrichosporon cavernicola]BEJ05454.1 hypothetical protein CcaverHIS641_0212710 [Cutaneotrichosporon cavernicola]
MVLDTLEKASLRVAHRARAALPPTLVHLYDTNFGLTLIALAQFFFASMSISVKWLMETTNMSTLTLIFVRMGITGTCCWVTLLLQRDPHPFLGPPGIRKLLLLRGFAGFSGLLCAYQALRGLRVSDAVTIGFLTPSVTALFGWAVLGESFSFREAVSGLVSLFGVVLISRPPFLFAYNHDNAPSIEPEAAGPARVRLGANVMGDEDSAARMIGATWAVVGVSFSATAYLTIRHIGTRASALHSISYFSMVCTIATGFAMLVFPQNLEWPKDVYGFCLVFLIGVFGFCAQALLTYGLQNEKAGRAGLAMYLQIFFAVILELLLFQTIPSFMSFLGTVIILSSAAWVAMSSLKSKPPPAVSDPESRPISRTPSPIPEGTRTIRGEHYDYASVPTDERHERRDRRFSNTTSLSTSSEAFVTRRLSQSPLPRTELLPRHSTGH